MKYCKYCGKELADNVSVCPNCGADLGMEAQSQPSMNSFNNNTQTVYTGSTAGWGVLGFFVPIVGLILFIVWNKGFDKPKGKAAGIGALISVIVSVVSYIIYFIIIFVVAGVASATVAPGIGLFLM